MPSRYRRLRFEDRNLTRLATTCGFAAPTVAIGAIVLATVVATPETFTWRGRALSDMGRYGTRTFLLFNGGLVLGGLLVFPFAWRLWLASEDVLERVGVALLAVASVGLVGVGIFFLGHTAFYLDRDLHGPAALTYFAVTPFAQWVYGTGAIRAGRLRRGLVSIWLGIVHPLTWLAWLLWLLAGEAVPAMTWFAVPEFVAALATAVWLCVLAIDVRHEDGL